MDLTELNQRYTDLLNERVGGRALACSDEWFAPCDNLVLHAEPVFKEGHFVSTGQWMDGWESRRSFRRSARDAAGVDYDWCVLRLGIPGQLAAVDVETTHFRGNAPEQVALEGAWVERGLPAEEDWVSLLPQSDCQAHSHNFYEIASDQACTHLRLKIYPDGGVARLRAWGVARVRRQDYVDGELLDLASVMVGGRGQQCSDMFYSSPSNLLMPYPGINMGDGWETRRRRDEGNDWCIVKLGLAGSIRKVIVDTAHFKGNFPDHFTLEATSVAGDDASGDGVSWQRVIGPSPLAADQSHRYIDEIEVPLDARFAHVRLNIFPDGGVSRLRVIGAPDWEGQS